MKHTFKTNINCGNCIKSVTPFLNSEIDIENWEVDIDDSNKILSVEADLKQEEIIKIVEQAGFKAEHLKSI